MWLSRPILRFLWLLPLRIGRGWCRNPFKHVNVAILCSFAALFDIDFLSTFRAATFILPSNRGWCIHLRLATTVALDKLRHSLRYIIEAFPSHFLRHRQRFVSCCESLWQAHIERVKHVDLGLYALVWTPCWNESEVCSTITVVLRLPCVLHI